jgi:hypothetical protein
MPTYRARVKEIQKAAIDKGVRATGNAIGFAAGLPAGTVNAVFNGRQPGTPTIAALVLLLGRPVEDLFELVEDDDDDDDVKPTGTG